MNRLTLRSCSLGAAEGKPSNLGRTNVRHSIREISFCANPPHSGILVRNDAARDRLQQRLGNSIIMSSLTFLCQLFT